MSDRTKNHSRQFERAVHDFARLLDPSAEIFFDHKVRDRDTGTMRQCDVWINTKIGGHWPLSILVSCKDHNRKLHVGDIGAFADEIRSTGASTGVIYSRRGFTKPALKKAKAQGIACCRLFLNERADIPSAVWFDQYTCGPYFRLVLQANLKLAQFATWNNIFDIMIEGDGQRESVIEIIERAYLSGQTKSVEEGSIAKGFPPDWVNDVIIDGEEVGGHMRIQVIGGWNRFRARMEALLLEGSYSIGDSSFRGSITGPPIDTHSAHPGEGWTKVEDASLALPSNRTLMILTITSIRETLRKQYGAVHLSTHQVFGRNAQT